MNARSRLKTPFAEEKSDYQPDFGNRHRARSLPSTRVGSGANRRLTWLPKYDQHIPTLVLALLSYAAVGYLVFNIHPGSIQNWLFPNSYLPFHLLWFTANFFLFSFLLLNSRRGYLVAFFLAIVGFLTLQSFKLTPKFAIVLLVLFAIIEILGTILEKSIFSHASFNQKPYTGRRKSTF